MKYGDGRGIKTRQWFTNELLRSGDISRIGKETYQNAVDFLASLSKQEARNEIIRGLRLEWDTAFTATLKAGAAVSYDGPYLVGDTWGFSAEAGTPFAVVVPGDQSVAFDDATGQTGDRTDILEVRPVEAGADSLTRNFKDPITGLVSSAIVPTGKSYGYEFQVTKGTPVAHPTVVINFPAETGALSEYGGTSIIVTLGDPATTGARCVFAFSTYPGYQDEPYATKYTARAENSWYEAIYVTPGESAASIATKFESAVSSMNSRIKDDKYFPISVSRSTAAITIEANRTDTFAVSGSATGIIGDPVVTYFTSPSAQATPPATTSGWIKLAEVRVVEGASDLQPFFGLSYIHDVEELEWWVGGASDPSAPLDWEVQSRLDTLEATADPTDDDFIGALELGGDAPQTAGNVLGWGFNRELSYAGFEHGSVALEIVEANDATAAFPSGMAGGVQIVGLGNEPSTLVGRLAAVVYSDTTSNTIRALLIKMDYSTLQVEVLSGPTEIGSTPDPAVPFKVFRVTDANNAYNDDIFFGIAYAVVTTHFTYIKIVKVGTDDTLSVVDSVILPATSSFPTSVAVAEQLENEPGYFAVRTASVTPSDNKLALCRFQSGNLIMGTSVVTGPYADTTTIEDGFSMVFTEADQPIGGADNYMVASFMNVGAGGNQYLGKLRWNKTTLAFVEGHSAELTGTIGMVPLAGKHTSGRTVRWIMFETVENHDQLVFYEHTIADYPGADAGEAFLQFGSYPLTDSLETLSPFDGDITAGFLTEELLYVGRTEGNSFTLYEWREGKLPRPIYEHGNDGIAISTSNDEFLRIAKGEGPELFLIQTDFVSHRAAVTCARYAEPIGVLKNSKSNSNLQVFERDLYKHGELVTDPSGGFPVGRPVYTSTGDGLGTVKAKQDHSRRTWLTRIGRTITRSKYILDLFG